MRLICDESSVWLANASLIHSMPAVVQLFYQGSEDCPSVLNFVKITAKIRLNSPPNMKREFILAIESSCDDTGAAVLEEKKLLSNEVAGQDVHRRYGGVVPELASRAHQQHIVPVVDAAIEKAGIERNDLSAIAYTRGPGLLGSLLVGTSFAKGLALAMNIPLIDVHHMQAHALAHFIEDGTGRPQPGFPFLCLTVSGGHTQIVLVRDYLDMEVIGQTKDDAAGEAFDKAAKIMELPYPGGPVIDKLAQDGNPRKYSFTIPQIPALDYSFSGLKTQFLYFLQDEVKKDSDFVEKNKHDICASLQHTIIEILLQKLELAAKQRGISDIAIAGGVSANSALRKAVGERAQSHGWNTYIPPMAYCTDNAAMIGIAGYFKYKAGEYSSLGDPPMARMKF